MIRFPRFFPLLITFLPSTLTVVSLLSMPAHAQEPAIYSFCSAANCTDGSAPYAGLAVDSKGNLYGTTYTGGANNLGTIFELSPATGGGWTETVLYSFCSTGGSNCTDGEGPKAGLIFDSSGDLYGSTVAGGAMNAGAVFELSPPTSGSGPWTEKALYSFCSAAECFDGENPYAGLIFDAKGNLYGTTFTGGTNGGGTAFELSPPSSGSGPWTETVLYSFGANTDGAYPYSSLIFDSKGNLYGTTHGGGPAGNGTAFELSPPASGSGPWNETVLYDFCSAAGCIDGDQPYASLILDSKGNLYGTTTTGGSAPTGYVGGVVFELTPPSVGTTPWTEAVLYSFCSLANCRDGSEPYGGLIFSSAGNLLGTTVSGGVYSGGVLFVLTPPSTGSGSWTEGFVDFCDPDCTDGGSPMASLIFDSSGNLYGTTMAGGTNNEGTVFEFPKPGSTVSLTSSVNPSSQGEAATFTATVSPSGPPVPTGTVAFTANGSIISGCSAVVLSSSVQAQCTTSALLPGMITVAATYSGDSNYVGSSASLIQVVKTVSTTSVSSSTNPSISGQAVTFTATVTPAGPPTPTGTVGFTALGTTITGCSAVTLTSAGTALCMANTLPVGTDAILATYSGDTYYLGSNGTLKQVVNKAPTTLSLVSSQNPSTFDQAVTFTATISSGSSPTGTLSFTSNGATISGCSAVTVASSQAQCITAALPVGNDAILATYSGDSNNVGSSSTVTQAVNLAPTTTGLVSSMSPSTSGQAVTFTATVSGGSLPTGTASFLSNGTTIGGCSAVTLASSQAQCTTSALLVGNDAIVATYSGDSNNTGSSGTLTQVVNSATRTATATTVTSSQNPSPSGQMVTLTATVAAAGTPIPTGSVSFTSLGTGISGCSDIALSTSLTAQCTTLALPVGTDAIVATYSGDPFYLGSSGDFSQLVNPVASPVGFVPMTPCRVVDTRNAEGPFGGPELAAGETRSFDIPSGPCAGIPTTATAYSLNVTVVPPAPLGYLTIWPAGEGQPVVSTLNSLDGRIKANAAIVPAGASGEVSVFVNNPTHVVLDINGYFESGGSSALEFYPLTPCRVADTRNATGPLGGPSLAAATERDFPILASSCGIPGGALAYSLNFTAIPPSGENLGYVTVWPQGESRPVVSTLNDVTGTIVANAAIVPAGTSGGVAVYPSGATNLVIDVNGYFALPGSGGLSLYALTPCRALDTRKTTGAFSGELVVNVAGSTCTPSSTAQAYVFNATAVPSGDLGYLTLWADGETQPVVSTLNAADGAITSNMAIVQNSEGQTDAFASGTTQLVMDISAYFAP